MGKVFVGGLSRETTTVGLRGYFERFGDISDCVVMKDRSTGAPRGFGFVTYASQQIADRVVKHRHIIDGKEVEAKPAVPRDADSMVPPRGAGAQPLPGGGAPMPPQPPAASGFATGPASNHAAPTPASNDFSSKKIFVGGLSHDTSEQDFIGYFSAARPSRGPRPLAPPPSRSSRGRRLLHPPARLARRHATRSRGLAFPCRQFRPGCRLRHHVRPAHAQAARLWLHHLRERQVRRSRL